MTMKAFKDYYQILGVERTASSIDIKKRYLALIKEYHPDINPGNSSSLVKFQEITEAYNILGNLDNRLHYSILLNKKRQLLINERKKQNKHIRNY